MKNLRNKIQLSSLFIMLFIASSSSQSISILKDSIVIDKEYYTLEDLKINLINDDANSKVYKIIQNTYDILGRSFVGTPEQRLKEKKDTLINQIKTNRIQQSNTGFEHYEIYCDKNNIINISIAIQSYKSPWEGIQYYSFDLKNGNRIGLDFFINRQNLLKKCKTKITEQNTNLKLKTQDLVNFKIVTDQKNTISGIDFSIFDTENYRNSGYEEFIIHFEWKEIKQFVAPMYKKRLL